MEIEIDLQNFHYPWNHCIRDESNNWWKGQIFFQKKLINIDDFKENIFLNLKSSEYDINKTIEILYQLNGSFSFIIENTDYVLCVVDRIRSIPLFYSPLDNHLVVSDDMHRLKERLKAAFNEEHGFEFLVTGYVTGPDTLFTGIYQLQAGEFLIFNKSNSNFSVHRYFHYLHGDYTTEPETKLLHDLDDVMMRVFTRLIDTTVHQGKTIVVPLSGGLDSRLIVAMLKRLGVKEVICFSYGKKGNNEAEISKKVAETLGYPWYFVEYTNKRWYDCYHSDEMRAYERYAGNLTSLPAIQDYLAVKILKEQGKIPDNAVFIPGHSGDMLAGSWIPIDIEELPHTSDFCINHSLQRHYSLWRWNNDDNEKLGSTFRQRIQKSIGNVNITNAESLANCIEYFNFNERQAKFIVNSVRVYEFFGYEWRIPLWDAELIDFFLRIPLSMRLNQSLYTKFGFERVFKGDLEELTQISCTTLKKYRSPRIKLNYIINIIFQRIPLSRTVAKKIFLSYKVITEYSSHPMNWYSIMSIKEFKKFYSGNENINSYLSKEYIKQIYFNEDFPRLLKFFNQFSWIPSNYNVSFCK